jgi:hypothetical protein
MKRHFAESGAIIAVGAALLGAGDSNIVKPVALLAWPLMVLGVTVLVVGIFWGPANCAFAGGPIRLGLYLPVIVAIGLLAAAQYPDRLLAVLFDSPSPRITIVIPCCSGTAHAPQTISWTSAPGRVSNRITLSVRISDLRRSERIWIFNAKTTQPTVIYPARFECGGNFETRRCIAEVGDPSRDSGYFYVWAAVVNQEQALAAAEVASTSHRYLHSMREPPHVRGHATLAEVVIKRP